MNRLQLLMLLVELVPSTVNGQRWTDSVILTQYGPVSYKPVHYSRPGGYYVADVLPAYPGEEPGKVFNWPSYSNTIEIPINSGINVEQIPLVTPVAKNVPMKRKKSTLKKNAYYKIPQYENPTKKLTIQNPISESSYGRKFNEMRNTVTSGYAYKGSRFLNRGLKVRQSNKLLKGQVIDHNKNQGFDSYIPQTRSNKRNLATQSTGNNRIPDYFNNGHQVPDLSSVQQPKFDLQIEEN